MDTLLLKKLTSLVGNFLIRLPLLYGVDLAAAKFRLESIDRCEGLVRLSIKCAKGAGQSSFYPCQHSPLAERWPRRCFVVRCSFSRVDLVLRFSRNG